jgi:hypothetical protein
MPNVPAVINRQALMSALADLGIDTDHLASITADARTVTLTYYAVNDQGQKYLTDGTPTRLVYDVPLRNAGGVVSTGEPVTVGQH